jgi:hypothetical protein
LADGLTLLLLILLLVWSVVHWEDDERARSVGIATALVMVGLTELWRRDGQRRGR